jgi:hypothetical protein
LSLTSITGLHYSDGREIQIAKKEIKTVSVSDIFMFNPEIKLIHWKTETDVVAHFKYTSRAIQRGLQRGSLQLQPFLFKHCSILAPDRFLATNDIVSYSPLLDSISHKRPLAQITTAKEYRSALL